MAIAPDAASTGNGTGTSLTVSHTCAGSDRGLFVAIVGDNGSDAVTGVTYNGVSCLLVGKVQPSGGRWVYLYYLSAPATGAHNVVVSASGSVYLEANNASYTGVSQTGQPEASATNSNASTASLTVTTSTITDNAWCVLAGSSQAGTLGAGSGTTLRTSTLVGAILDSGAALTPAGSKSLIVTGASTNFMGGVIAAVAPAGGGGGGLAMPPRRAFPMSILNH